MAYLEMLEDAVERARERFYRTAEGLSESELNTFAAEETAPSIKSVGWLLWHTAREMDFQISDLMGQEPLWTRQGFKEEFDLDLPDDTQDWCHTPEEAHKVKATWQQYQAYYDAATELTKTYLRQVDEASLSEVIDEAWEPPVTREVRLVSIIDDAIMHSGQAVYARRLLGLED